MITTTPELNEGERYIGGIVSADGTTTHIILLPGDIEANWNDAMAWAKEQGGDLPTRVELALMFATAKDEFKPSAYWSNQSESGWAWYQNFNNGNQNNNHKSYEGAAVAVRRSTPVPPSGAGLPRLPAHQTQQRQCVGLRGQG